MQITAGSTFKDFSVSFPGQKWPFGLRYPWGIERHYTDHPRGHEAGGISGGQSQAGQNLFSMQESGHNLGQNHLDSVPVSWHDLQCLTLRDN